MRNSDRIVTGLPLGDLWNDSETLSACRLRWLGKNEIHELLRSGPVQFIIAAVGERLNWIVTPDTFTHWKQEVSPRLADPDAPRPLDEFPGCYCYFASEWRAEAVTVPIVLFERHH